MRIAHFYGHSGTTGVTWSILDVSRRLRERGHQVHVICRSDSELTAYPGHASYLYLMGAHRPFLRALLRRQLAAWEIDVLNVHSQRDAPLAMAVARHLGIPTVYSCRELSEKACRDAAQASRVIAVSAGVGAFLQQQYGVRPPTLHVIPNGVDFATLPPQGRTALRAECGFVPEDVWVAFVGRVVKNKNVSGLLRAFARIARQAPALRLAIVGEGHAFAEVRRLAQTLTIADRVRFTGWLPRDQAFRMLGASDALVLPSLGAEGLSNALLAAMALGVPALASDLPSLANGPLRDGDTGWLCAPTDESLGDGLLRVLACGAAGRRRLGEAARQEIERHHRMERVIDRLEIAYFDAAGIVPLRNVA